MKDQNFHFLPLYASAVCLGWALVPTLSAQTPPPQMNGPRGHRPPPPIVQALDVNRDHEISADEIANAATLLLKLDKNHDGQLTDDELRPAPPKNAVSSTTNKPPQTGDESSADGHKPPRPPFPLMQALDTNGDGILSAEEIRNAPQSLKTLDANHDGKLTPDEFAPPRPPQEENGNETPPAPSTLSPE